MSVFTKVLRAGEGKKVRRLAELVPLVGALEPEMQGLSDDALAHKTVEFRERLDQGETLDDLLIESYAVVREAAWRARALPDGARHAVIVACMIAMYLSKDSSRTPQMRARTRSLAAAGGSLPRLLLPVLRAWRLLYSQRDG